MRDSISQNKGYIIAAVLGAIGGGLIVAVATRALPQIMSRMMAGMMQNMMAQMAKDGQNPTEMCQQMMTHFAEAQQVAVGSEGMGE